LKVFIIGSGGREHAITKLIRRSVFEPRIYVAMDYRNPGLERESVVTGGKWFIVNTENPNMIARIAEEISPDLIVVGPEEPQFSGVSDVLREKGFTVFGASSRCAEIEKSKVFARTLMWKYEIEGRLYFKAFRDVEEARINERFRVQIRPKWD
jgi:phosphoribosylamine--glycine ligase